ncbi:heme o synthase [Pseudoalteromonas luteoviolacea]|uniref:Protoheme IX farnesyltransferase n=1 Tax=Pseudoalteromonas luteoviolacea S4054 TaxID=1129367 RepID=A0A0F6ADC5_9GAMM|nr:heme o synthase [Pseudoalteromonas luteoviolacea]AOT06718.1 protoheme IX farnesyltransferase [Pseudoalteromonas luteoviolacea]AOT11636.1 protoheme IX farnesyltransferase [Pseudoalteromonas luteoviolacea]AOT16548.1 protoheme IX farnesyltransferase [Pseudoalteromonas luteoviolacea]KKE83806.1 hypothetical protein N479_12500 [Pseudoalteromonas luteoviolacea S4054]KZN73911.1 hypothetical protein N481_10755 [Pseudoalteromonas luteoviolacea S4047-1]
MNTEFGKYTYALEGVAKHLQAYVNICKPKVVLMLVLTAWVGIVLAPDTQRSGWLQLGALLGIGFVSAAAAAINHILDRARDKRMARTRHRPLVMNQLSVSQAYLFAFMIGMFGVLLLLLYSNWLCTLLTVLALFGYAVVYTVYLKRSTPQNIVIGGLAGAMPPLLGWVSETQALSAEPWLLVMMIFTWTPPHFWALAIARKQDYERANVPMLPVTHGIQFTKLCMIAYTILLVLVCILPYLIGMSGLLYLAVASFLNARFLQKVVLLYFESNSESAMQVFRFSISYLLLLFSALFIDKLVT